MLAAHTCGATVEPGGLSEWEEYRRNGAEEEKEEKEDKEEEEEEGEGQVNRVAILFNGDRG